jgi:bifunctional DNA-binding transcriptional regulator/antitoxin component of YhaV-PrlF toxin-antitoxin module
MIGTMMARTRLSRRYQVTIPHEMRDGRHPGQYVNVMRKGNIVVLMPERPISAYRGILKGVPTTGFREKSDRQF